VPQGLQVRPARRARKVRLGLRAHKGQPEV